MRARTRIKLNRAQLQSQNALFEARPTLSILISLAFFCFALSSAAQSSVQFEDYEVPVYSGAVHRPKWIRHVVGDEWRDNLGKLVELPEINFAGKYFVSVHSCGTGCRYYTLTDLSVGRELDLLKDFAAAEPPSKTREGYPYITDLVTRANSKLLVAQYRVESPRGEECRERAFVFDGDKLTPTTGTRRTCSHIKYAVFAAQQL
jgi:hypothetical protein